MTTSQELVDALVSHAQMLGVFELVNSVEPKSPPSPGLTCSVWVQGITPVAEVSGLAATAALFRFSVRLYTSMLQEQSEHIDPRLMDACDKLMQSYTSEFRLAGLVTSIDLLGAHGQGGLEAEAGYVQIGGGALYRILTINVPCLIADYWTQEA